MNEVSRVAMDSIVRLEESLLELPQHEFEVNHYYSEGVYTRELLIPKDVVLTGKVHRDSCINILLKGSMLVVTSEDEYRIEAPYVFVSGAGVKKSAVALEDSIWITSHPWNGKDNDKEIVEKITMSNVEALENKT